MTQINLSSEFLNYLSATYHSDRECDRLPPLSELSKQLGVSVSSLREQMEVARALGLIEARPRTGLRRLPYDFLPAAKQSLFVAIAIDQDYFLKFADLRRHLETAYWYQAVASLTPDDHARLRDLIDKAWRMLRGGPIQIPQAEHRELHLTIYRRLDNPFVIGLLEAYWDAYEAVGLNLYEDYRYLEQVWRYHERMVESICAGEFEAGYLALVEHADLIYHRLEPHEVTEHVARS